MAKLVTKFRYYKPTDKQKIGGLAKYIATRDGVEFCDESKKFAPATKNQRKLIEDILEQFPDSVQMLEYDDYIVNPTVKNATEFITRALEDNAPTVMNKATYADYIATRPRVEKQGSHGLFTDNDTEIILSKVSEEMNHHTGNFWTMIVSLRREDAERLGYDNAAQWKDTLRKHTKEFSEALKIPLTELKWYAAFHNESHHPHIHLIAYSETPGIGYLTKHGVHQMRSALGQDIFKDELQHIYREQTERRNRLKKDWKTLLEDILKRIENGTYDNQILEQKLIELSVRLSNTKAKKVYGYLQKEVKALIDSIVDELAKDERIVELYDLWYEKKYEILQTYTSDLPPKIPLSENKEFKSIKNEIIREAMRIHNEGGDTFRIEPSRKTRDGGGASTCSQQPKVYRTNKVSAVAVTRLFRSLATLFQDKISGDSEKKMPTIDKRLQREIDEKRNAEIGMF